MWIKQLIQRHTVLTKGLVTGFLFSAADAITQKYIEKNLTFDWRRNFEFLFLGLFWIAPSIEIWYSHLLPKITARYLANYGKTKQLLLRVLIDGLISPTVQYIGFYTIKNTILSQNKEKINFSQEFHEKFVPTLLADWMVWTPANLINFMFLPVQYQGLYVGVNTFFFNLILSYISNKELEYEKENKKEVQEAIILHKPVVHHQESLEEKIIHKLHPSQVEVIV